MMSASRATTAREVEGSLIQWKIRTAARINSLMRMAIRFVLTVRTVVYRRTAL